MVENKTSYRLLNFTQPILFFVFSFIHSAFYINNKSDTIKTSKNGKSFVTKKVYSICLFVCLQLLVVLICTHVRTVRLILHVVGVTMPVTPGLASVSPAQTQDPSPAT